MNSLIFLDLLNKLNSLDMFQIGMGADYGNFINYEFVDQEKNISELTSIGYPANKAAKLQALADNGELIVSENLALLIKKWRPIFVFNNLNNEKTNKIIKKYKDLKGYSFPYNVYFNDDNFIKRNNLFSFEEKDDSIQKLKDKLSVNFQDIGFTDSNNQIDFSNISLKQSKRIQGSVLYADIRGFTKKFKEDGSNLPQMSVLTKKVLQRMYKCVIDYNGVHIQFQGDCESGIDNDYGNREIDYALECIFSGMSILDNIEKVNQEKEIQEGLDYQKIAVGIGCSIGTIYATRIGVRNQKDNLILGETVHEADIAEDEEAQENELVITTEFYNHLVTDIQDSKIANIIKQIFKLRNNYYYTKIGMKKYRELLNTDYVDKNSEDARKNGHLKPWSY
jgi:class 3 adenylate cyclase